MFEDNGYLITRFADPAPADLCRAIVDRHFPIAEEERFNKLSAEEMHELVYEAQREINDAGIQELVFKHEKAVFEREFGPNLMRDRVCFLRGIRPSKKDSTKTEALGLHRETMYSDPPHEKWHCINMWFPIRGVTQDSSLKYIPNSHKVPDEDLKIEIDTDGPRVKKHSTGHKLGNLYAPKKIVGGVDINNLQAFDVSYGEYVLFSAMMVHGAAANRGNNIRFSLSMAIIPQAKAVVNKSYFAADGKSHYEKFGGTGSNTP